jgi:alkanesulfonate monooxygenase SsuD/methylene tetrahydromethanopterin reductase-like flavin-dependent oxidoreductase (luciferase family)
MAEQPKPPAGGPTSTGGVRPVPRIIGPVAPPVYTAGAKPASARIVAETAGPLVTEGMKARQRDIEKKRRVVATLRAVEEEEATERWGRGRAWIFRTVGILIALGVYLKMQTVYGDRWPILAVWIFLGVLLGVAVSWMLWYLDYSD